MLFHVRMDVNIPRDLPEAQVNEIKAVEKAYSQELQASTRTSVFLMSKVMKSYITFYKVCHFIRL